MADILVDQNYMGEIRNNRYGNLEQKLQTTNRTKLRNIGRRIRRWQQGNEVKDKIKDTRIFWWKARMVGQGKF